MDSELLCFRCGNSLATLTLPLSRLDECPACAVYLHVCRMCRHFDAAVAKQCREDDAEEVLEKERANFCEWFKPSASAYDPAKGAETQQAQDALAALFGDGDDNDPKSGHPPSAADDLFK